jgi:hypothetical protein
MKTSYVLTQGGGPLRVTESVMVALHLSAGQLVDEVTACRIVFLNAAVFIADLGQRTADGLDAPDCTELKDLLRRGV